jgi:hypothetical protein
MIYITVDTEKFLQRPNPPLGEEDNDEQEVFSEPCDKDERSACLDNEPEAKMPKGPSASSASSAEEATGSEPPKRNGRLVPKPIIRGPVLQLPPADRENRDYRAGPNGGDQD